MMKPPPLDLSLPYITDGLEGIGGTIRARPEDFIVEEVPLYEPSGYGSHLYVNITKRSQTTRDVQVQLAELFKVRPRNIGTAGLKDKHAVTTQTFSILVERNDVEAGEALERIEGRLDVRANWAKFHGNKFRAGHLIGNKFKIVITDLRMPTGKAVERAKRITDVIHRRGFPNYYGAQRMGKNGQNVHEGWEIFRAPGRSMTGGSASSWFRRTRATCATGTLQRGLGGVSSAAHYWGISRKSMTRVGYSG